MQCWSAGAQYLFMERLFDAFDLDGNHSIDFEEFIQGLGVFIKGTPEEKMELSFRMYDIDKSGEVEKKEMISVMGRLVCDFGGFPVLSIQQCRFTALHRTCTNVRLLLDISTQQYSPTIRQQRSSRQ